jgi:hypothetical protein
MHKRLIYISNGKTFTGEGACYDIMTQNMGVMPPPCNWHQIFVYVVDGTAVQVTREEAEKLLETLKKESKS